MFNEMQFFAHGAIWLAQFFYIISYIPQIIKNFMRGTVKGLSDLLILGYLNGYLAFFYYLICLGLPFAYKVMSIAQFVIFLIIVYQRINYDATDSAKGFATLFAINMFIALLLIPLATMYPRLIGGVGGWVGVALFSGSQIFQASKVYFEKSVIGFSFYFIIFATLGGIFELFAAFVLLLPLQTQFALCRALVMYTVFFVQFWMYKT